MDNYSFNLKTLKEQFVNYDIGDITPLMNFIIIELFCFPLSAIRIFAMLGSLNFMRMGLCTIICLLLV